MSIKIKGLSIFWVLLISASYGHAQIVQGSSQALGQNSFAAGDSSIAYGLVSIALGQEAIAEGDYSTSIGRKTYAKATNSFAMGQETQALGTNSFASGIYTLAIGQSSFASGFGSNATGNSSVALGVNTYTGVRADGAVAIGGASSALGIASFATGQENVARSIGENVFGLYAEDYTPEEEFSTNYWYPDDRLFTIGNGTSNTERSNAFVMLKDGDTEMAGNLTVSQRLNVGDDIDSLAVDTLGDIRFNRSNGDFEGYTLLGWQSLTSIDVTASRSAIGEWVQKTNNKSFGNAFSQFLLIRASSGEIKGEAKLSEFRDQIEVYDFKGQINGTNLSHNGELRHPSGKPNIPQFEIIKPADISTTDIKRILVNNELVDEMILSWALPENGQGSEIETFAKYYFKDVVISSVEHFYDEERSEELNRLKFSPTAIKIEYYKESESGSFQLANVVEYDYLRSDVNY